MKYEGPYMHEFVVSTKKYKENGIRALDIAKRLIDYGVHPPTIYFPLVVKEDFMIEPTETENKETLDEFAEAIEKIIEEIKRDPEILKHAPHSTPIGRLDEVWAVKNLVLRYEKDK